MSLSLEERAEGLLLGGAVGDALGLRTEGLSPADARRTFGDSEPRWLLVSDDTEHAAMTAQALLAARGDVDRFATSLAWRLGGWFLALPPGIGLATLRACLRLCLGAGPRRSGVFSAGNGPLMRAPVVGFVLRDPAARVAFVDVSTRLTHTDPLAVEAARALAEAAACAREGIVAAPDVLAALRPHLRSDAWHAPLALLEDSLAHGLSPAAWAEAAGLEHGVSGFVVHTLPAALFTWLRRPTDVRAAVSDVIALGGDTDSTGAIVGALAGAAAGAHAVPAEWLARVLDRPLTIAWLRRLAPRLTGHARPLPMPARALYPLRNLLFFAVIVLVLLRRFWGKLRP